MVFVNKLWENNIKENNRELEPHLKKDKYE